MRADNQKVPLTQLQILDAAVKAGGANLSKTQLGCTRAADGQLLERMCSDGLFERSGNARQPKFTLTENGRATWEKEAPPEAVAAVRAQAEELLFTFLGIVERQPGIPLTAADARKIPTSVQQHAIDRGLVEPGPRGRGYRLLSPGELALLARLPAEEQIRGLRDLLGETVARLKAAQESLAHELCGSGLALRPELDSLASRGSQSLEAFDAVVGELAAYPVLVKAANQLRDECTRAQQVQGAELIRLREQERQLRELGDREQQKLAFCEQLIERLAEVSPAQTTDCAPTLLEETLSFLRMAELELYTAKSGTEVNPKKLLGMLESFSDDFMAALDIQPLGTLGEEVAYDPELHESVEPLEVGEKVWVKRRGYRRGDKLLHRVFVSRRMRQ